VSATGEFVRRPSRFRDRPQGGPERHHLYVALACPWSQRTVIVRSVLGLADRLGISYLDPFRDERGWAFSGGRFTDDVNGFAFLKEAYDATDRRYDGRISVPVLWDKEDERIVSNESADLVRIFNDWAGGDLYPPDKRAEIDELNEWIYAELQNGVYRAGFARSQEAYDAAYRGVFAALPRLEELLSARRYLTGDAITEADWRLLPRCCASTPSTTRTSAATARGSSTSPTCCATRRTSTSSRASRRRSAWTRSSAITTRRTMS